MTYSKFASPHLLSFIIIKGFGFSTHKNTGKVFQIDNNNNVLVGVMAAENSKNLNALACKYKLERKMHLNRITKILIVLATL